MKFPNGWIGVRSPIQNNVLKSCEMLSCEQVKNLKLKVNTGYCVNPCNHLSVDKAPRLSIRRVIWILASDICLTQPIITNTETAMLSRQKS